MRKTLFWLLVASLVIALSSELAFADGMLFPTKTQPTQPFSVKYHRVTVTIDNQIAKTHIDQAFVNDTGQTLEGTYLFPVPEGARVRDFAIYEGDKALRGELLPKEKAVAIYEDIVRRQRDPGLLEYVGRDTIRARIFPIPPHSEKRITIDYAEVISRDGELCRYLYPLSTERFSARPLEEVTISVRIKSQAAIKNVYCPSHEVSIKQLSDHDTVVSYEASQLKPATDFELFYTLNEDAVGLTLLTYKEKGERGYWMLLASPKLPVKGEIVPKEVVFVLDRTGSMKGEKIQQAKDALRFCLHNLDPRDRFNLVTFNETPESIGNHLMPATSANVHKAEEFIRDLRAQGGTNINEALGQGLQLFPASTRPQYLVFLTDGQPTVGETNPDLIRKHVAAKNEGRVRFFVFGVGYDVNVHFLDQLSEENRGLSEYVRPEEDVEAKVSRFYSKVSAPVLTDVSLHTSGVKVTDIFPRGDLPDIFAGSQTILVGTYPKSGRATFTLKGKQAAAGGGARTMRYVLKADLPARDTKHDFIPVLWASRRIGYLLDEVRLHHNQELVDEIVSLSREFGIMTEFTAFLAAEPGLSLEEAERRVLPMIGDAADQFHGSWSVGQAQNAARLKSAAAPQAAGGGRGGGGGFVSAYGAAGPAGPPASLGATSNQAFIDASGRVQNVAGVQNVGRQTFYQQGKAWVDQRVGPKTPTVNIQRLSEAHFQLARVSAEARRYLALGDNVTFFMNGQAIVVGDTGKQRLRDSELKAITA